MSFKQPLQALRETIDELERDGSLDAPENLRLRIEALDRLDAWRMDEALQAAGALSFIGEIGDRVRALSSRLERVNAKLYDDIRKEIQQNAGAKTLRRFFPVRSSKADGHVEPNGEGYDSLDELIAGVLKFEESTAAGADLAAEMVPYQPTPARHIVDMIDRVALTARDVLVDLGSGLGHVPMLASICTAACGIGVELDGSYVESSLRIAMELKLDKVNFIQQDARMADLSAGTVFYLYTPFKGGILRQVLDSLKREAVRRPIRICTFGPCTPIIAEESWLKSSDGARTDRVSIFVPQASRE